MEVSWSLLQEISDRINAYFCVFPFVLRVASGIFVDNNNVGVFTFYNPFTCAAGPAGGSGIRAIQGPGKVDSKRHLPDMGRPDE